jgi:hypothetical protein
MISGQGINEVEYEGPSEGINYLERVWYNSASRSCQGRQL